MNTGWLEIILLTLGTMLIPFALWIAAQMRASLLHEIKILVIEYCNGFDPVIAKHKQDLRDLKTRLNYRSELAILKYTAIADKIDEIETYLEKSNGYRRRSRLDILQANSVLDLHDPDIIDNDNERL